MDVRYAGEDSIDHVLMSFLSSSDEFAHRTSVRGRRGAMGTYITNTRRETKAEDTIFTQRTSSQMAYRSKPQPINHSMSLSTALSQEDLSMRMHRPDMHHQWSGLTGSSDIYSFSEEKGGIDFLGQAQWKQGGNSHSAEAIDSSALINSALVRPTFPRNNVIPASSEQLTGESMCAPSTSDSHPVFNNPFAEPDHHHGGDLIHDLYSKPSEPELITRSTPMSIFACARSGEATQSLPNVSSDYRIPDLEPAFFESEFYRRFHTQSKPVVLVLGRCRS